MRKHSSSNRTRNRLQAIGVTMLLSIAVNIAISYASGASLSQQANHRHSDMTAVRPNSGMLTVPPTVRP